MTDVLGALLDRLQALFGKSFVVVGLLPVGFALLFCLPLLPLVAPETPYLVDDVVNLPATKQMWVYLCAVLVVVFVGFLLHATNASFRRGVAGGVPGIRTWMTRTHRKDLERLEERRRSIRRDLVAFRVSVEQNKWRDELAIAKQAGLSAGGTAGPSDELKAQMERLRDRCSEGEQVAYLDAKAVFDLLEKELAQNNARQVPALSSTHIEFLDLARRALHLIDGLYTRLSTARYLQYPGEPDRVRGTLLANLIAAHQDFVYERYGMNVELFWPALSKFASADPAFAPSLDEPKLRMDFAIAMMVVSVLFTVTWVVLLPLAAAPAVSFWTVAIGGPLAAHAFYRMAVANAHALHATVRGAIDLFRFDVLKALHCPLPATLVDEKALWLELTRVAEQGTGTVTYAHT